MQLDVLILHDPHHSLSPVALAFFMCYHKYPLKKSISGRRKSKKSGVCDCDGDCICIAAQHLNNIL